ncbi:polysaccharide pyruvyl transferase family protein [Demequina phytophila]|uniref:polysaccharide pyruvyl transferase family protein n=1 Tax=Demequina phytophila TaxID=1638981 RepID=UPI00078264E8|nr:polysaccharide pyruvyl transferase family protein [Demequina phytophila]
MPYTETMHRIAMERFSELFEGISSLSFADVPDYPNVGDSAIFLGQATFAREAGIDIGSAYSIGTLPRGISRLEVRAVAINGGGNIGGRYAHHEDNRFRLAREMPDDQVLIQCPQSVFFEDEHARRNFEAGLGARTAARIAVRDEESFSAVRELVSGRLLLAPDAVHFLGRIDAPAPRARFVVLGRADDESAARFGAGALDWPVDRPVLRATTWARKRAAGLGPAGQRQLNPSPARWERIAALRLRRGIRMLALGEVVVTDRLHAMLIALQMGRHVVAVDNANQKLSRYARTWLGGSGAALSFATSWDEAIRSVE